MKKLDYFALFFIQLAVLTIVVCFQSNPGYMDAEYYYANGIQLSEGKGFTEPFIWNYLDDPVTVTHPSHTYWMPLPSILSATGIVLLGSQTFLAGRIIFLILATLIPLLTAFITMRLSNKRASSWLAGLLSIFAGFYILYYSISDTFVPYMLLGGTVFLVILNYIQKKDQKICWEPFFLGILAGLMHLSRSDGLIWFGASLPFLIWYGIHFKKNAAITISSLLICLFGYLLIMGVWYARNLSLFGGIFAPGNSKVFWLTQYDELFSFPASRISLTNWWGLGFIDHVKMYLTSLLSNLGTVLGVEGSVFLIPLIILGIISSWKNGAIKFFTFLWITSFILMTFVFPFAGMRGGFLHATAAFELVFIALVPIGMQKVIDAGIRKRHWKQDRSIRMFYPALAVVAMLFTMLIFWGRVVGPDLGKMMWDQHAALYSEIESKLVEIGAEPDDVVMVTNPPGYYVSTRRSSIVMPFGDETVLLTAADVYDADYLILSPDHVYQLDVLYLNAQSTDQLQLIDTSIADVQIYKIIQK